MSPLLGTHLWVCSAKQGTVCIRRITSGDCRFDRPEVHWDHFTQGSSTLFLWSPSYRDKSRSWTRRSVFPFWTWAGWEDIFDSGSRDVPTWASFLEPDQSSLLERIAGGRITVEKYIEEIEISWDMYKFHPHVYFEGWTTWVSLYEPRTGSTAVKIAGVSVHIFGRAKFMATSMTHDTTANVSGLTPDMWPVMSFITADGGLYGLILRIMGDNVFERLGCFLASMGLSWAWGVRGDGEAVAYRDTDYGYLPVIAAVQRGVKVYQLAKLECERPTIKLV
jgi:hypothetical protein